MKIKEMSLYLVFGVLTTVINFLVYFGLIEMKFNYIVSTTVAFIISVLFAYFTNKKYVFLSKSGSVYSELIKFFLSRIFTYFLDLLGLVLLISVLHYNEVVSKIIINVVIVILNYIFSKKWIFNK